MKKLLFLSTLLFLFFASQSSFAQTYLKLEGDTSWTQTDVTASIEKSNGKKTGWNHAKKEKIKNQHFYDAKGKKYIDTPDDMLYTYYELVYSYVTNLVVQVTTDNSHSYCYLYNGWTSAGGTCIALFINYKLYLDPATHWGLFTSEVNGMAIAPKDVPNDAGPNGIFPGGSYKDYVVTYHTNMDGDTTGLVEGSTKFTSPIVICIAPNPLPCSTGTSTPPGSTCPPKSCPNKQHWDVNLCKCVKN